MSPCICQRKRAELQVALWWTLRGQQLTAHQINMLQQTFIHNIHVVPHDGKFQGDSRARLVYSHRAHATLVTEHLDEGFFLVGRPEGDRAVMVAQVDDGVIRVLAHHIKSTRLGADGCHLLSHRHVKVLQETCSALRTRTRTGSFVRADYDHWNQLENSILLFHVRGFQVVNLWERCVLLTPERVWESRDKSSHSFAYLFAHTKLIADSAHSKWGILWWKEHASSIGTVGMYVPLWQAKSGRGGTAYGGRHWICECSEVLFH